MSNNIQFEGVRFDGTNQDVMTAFRNSRKIRYPKGHEDVRIGDWFVRKGDTIYLVDARVMDIFEVEA